MLAGQPPDVGLRAGRCDPCDDRGKRRDRCDARSFVPVIATTSCGDGHGIRDVDDLGWLWGVVEGKQAQHCAVVDPLCPECLIEFDAHPRECGQRDLASSGDALVQHLQQLRQQRPDGLIIGKHQIGLAFAADHGEPCVGHHCSFLTTVRVSGSMVSPDAGSV